MEITLRLALPRDELSVPVVRRLLKQAMQVLGIDDATSADIELALTEACTNVMNHAADVDEYEVSAGIDGNRCTIEVVDHGSGFHSSELGRKDAAGGAEGGRGIQLMRALVDRVSFENQSQDGTVVHLEKTLEFKPSAALKALSDRR